MFIDLTCPVEIFRTALPTEEVPAAALTLFNLSGRIISSVEVSLRMKDADGRETDQLSYRGRALNGRPHSTFLMSVPCTVKNVAGIDAAIEKVWFSDNEVWRRDPARAVEYTPNNLPLSPALTRLQYTAGETAVGYPARQDNLWICVCGRPNPADDAFCTRCGRQQDEVFASFSPEAVDAGISLREKQLDLNSRNMREDTIRLQRIREEEYYQRRQRHRRRLRIAISYAVFLLLSAGFMFFCVPELRLLAGQKALTDGNHDKASAVFASLGNFGNADALFRESEWQKALARAADTDSPESMAEASALLRAVPDRPEAIEKANETDLLRSRLLLAQGDREGAAAALVSVPADTPGLEGLLQEIRLAEGRELLKNEQYEEAREIFQELKDLPEAKELASQCVYLPALAMMEREDWDGAIDAFGRIPDYLDSRDLALRCHYHKAEAMENEGDWEGAAYEYLMAGETEDAKERMTSLTLLLAEQQLSQGNLKQAHTLYASLPDSEEAVKKDISCRLILAKNALDDREYTLALEYLEGIPDDEQNAGTLRAAASWEKAQSAALSGDWNTVYDLLSPLDRPALRQKYRDIENLYLEACDSLGIPAYPETPDPEAVLPEPMPEATDLPPFLVDTEDEPEPAEADPFLVTEDDEP